MGRPRKDEKDRARPKILGIRVSDKTLAAFKIEAARRSVSVADLFDEIWTKYQTDQGAKE